MTSLRVLLVEDSENDAALVVRALQREYELYYERVDTAQSMLKALEDKTWDLVITDYSMPHFDALSAIAVMQEKQPDTPVIIVSGTMGEETAVEAMKAGAKDYVMKDRLARLSPAVARELRESASRARLHESEEQLRQAQKMEAVGHLAGCIAHDFNNVLSVIIMYCDTLLMGSGMPDPVVKGLEQIRKSGMRAANLTRQLLAFSRKQVLEPQVIDLNIIGSGFEKMLQRLLGEEIELSMDLLSGLWHIKADPGQVEQIMMNLALNARDAMPKGGRLSIRTSNVTLEGDDGLRKGLTQGSYVMLSVTDTGHGIDAETQKRIFDPFFTTKSSEKGTGLGLSTVYGIAKQSGGFVYVRSAPGEGASFDVYFPRVALPLSVQKSEENIVAKAHLQSPTILLMEDQEDVREVFASALRKNGYVVLSPSSCNEALLLLDEYKDKIHLLVTDVVMPVLSGPELAKRFISVCPRIKIILMSGYLSDEMEKHEVMKDYFLFLQKPFSLQQLLSKINEGLKSVSDT